MQHTKLYPISCISIKPTFAQCRLFVFDNRQPTHHSIVWGKGYNNAFVNNNDDHDYLDVGVRLLLNILSL